jgi:hypothetical protein
MMDRGFFDRDERSEEAPNCLNREIKRERERKILCIKPTFDDRATRARRLCVYTMYKPSLHIPP